MRLGQLAKKHDIPVKEIITYLEGETGEKFHPNAKLYDTLESKVFDHFQLQPIVSPPEIEVADEPVAIDSSAGDTENTEQKVEVPEPTFPSTPEEEIALLEGDLGDMPASESNKSNEKLIVESEQVVAKVEPSEDEVIQTDKLLELLESEESPADLDKIKLIKAPKRELSGLKVLGKVDLPEPKKKEEKQSDIITEKDLKEYRNPRKKRQPLSDEEKEKRRLKAKRKKEAYEARQEKRRKEREEQERKARKEEHYKQKLEQAKAVQSRRKTKQLDPQVPIEKENDRPEPKTLLGKFWKWMNT